MAINADTASMALFCDFENIALGVRDAQYEKFDIRPVLERLLAKGSIVVKKAYCDWDRYKGFKSAMHEANFELIEIPHVRQSGKNSADIRMVVDALDLCYTKAHVDTFVIISGDSDFSPLVSKLRENAKKVIGVGVKQSCSDLLVTNCDEFIYYDDLVREREAERAAQRREREKRSPEDEQKRREKQEERKSQAVDIVHATFVDLMADSGGSERIWASVLKEVVKRRNPGFNESYYGFRSFGNLLEEAASRGLLGFGRDDKGAYVTRGQGWSALAEGEGAVEAGAEVVAVAVAGGDAASPEAVVETAPARGRGRRRPRQDGEAPAAEAPVVADAGPAATTEAEPVVPAAPQAEAAASPAPAGRARGGRGRRGRTDAAVETAVAEAPAAVAPVQAAAVVEAAAVAAPAEATAKPARARGGRRSRQESATGEAAAAVTPVEAQADKATAGGKRPAKKAADAVAKAVRQPARSRKAKPAAE